MDRLAQFKISDRAMRYSQFVPRLYNWCISLGFEPNKILPSQAFCSDENQGYPIILINKHFGTFPFNHGKEAGVVETDRHASQAKHGQDLVVIQASHIGYDPDTNEYGRYRRSQTGLGELTSSCDVIADLLKWYLDEYQFACDNIFLERVDGKLQITINNQYLDDRRKVGLMLNLNRLLQVHESGHFHRIDILSTSNVFVASQEITDIFNDVLLDRPTPIGSQLVTDYFFFRCDEERQKHKADVEQNLTPHMQAIVTHPFPTLAAAQINTIVEFDRVFRTFSQDNALKGRKVLFISGLNVDISPKVGGLFPLTKFIPWAAYYKESDGSMQQYEQEDLWSQLNRQSSENPHQITLEAEISRMSSVDQIEIGDVK